MKVATAPVCGAASGEAAAAVGGGFACRLRLTLSARGASSEKPGKDALMTGAEMLFGETGRNPFQNRFMCTRLQKLAEPELYCVRE